LFITNILRSEEFLDKMEGQRIEAPLDHVYNYTWELLYPNSPETQAEMSDTEFKRFDILESELESIISELRAAAPNLTDIEHRDFVIFEESIGAWKAYRNVYADYMASSVIGGSMYPTLRTCEMSSITDEKIKSLRRQFVHIVGKR
jgi:hypothetical protein